MGFWLIFRLFKAMDMSYNVFRVFFFAFLSQNIDVNGFLSEISQPNFQRPKVTRIWAGEASIDFFS